MCAYTILGRSRERGRKVGEGAQQRIFGEGGGGRGFGHAQDDRGGSSLVPAARGRAGTDPKKKYYSLGFWPPQLAWSLLSLCVPGNFGDANLFLTQCWVGFFFRKMSLLMWGGRGGDGSVGIS